MEKINFKNLPDKSTPINATNLNQLQDNVEASFNVLNNILNKSFIVAECDGGAHSITMTKTKIPLKNIKINNGSKLSIEDNAIKIGQGIKTIKASAQLRFQEGFNVNDIVSIYLEKNDEPICVSGIAMYKATPYITINIAPIFISVTENDLINIKIMNEWGARGAYFGGYQTYLTVEEVN